MQPDAHVKTKIICNALIRSRRKKTGEGIYALQDISAGVKLCVFSGKVIDFNSTLIPGEEESYAMQIDIDRYIFLDPPARCFNHSCEPNCG